MGIGVEAHVEKVKGFGTAKGLLNIGADAGVPIVFFRPMRAMFCGCFSLCEGVSPRLFNVFPLLMLLPCVCVPLIVLQTKAI